MPKLLREPLFHFLLLGGLLFLVFDLNTEADEPSERRIVVTPAQLDQLSAQFSRTWLRPPSSDELEGLVERYVRSEIFYREALAMGLGQDDPYVRNRLALKLEVLLDDLSSEADPSEAELAEFLDRHSERFMKPAQLSFRQVYLNPAQHQDWEAEAQRLLERLRKGEAPTELGDVSILPHALDEVTPEEITGHFGRDFLADVEGNQPGTWFGPVASSFGVHLVLITGYQAERKPALAEVRGAVEQEWRDQRRRQSRELAYQRLRERYQVQIEAAEPAADNGESPRAGLVSETEQGQP